MDNEKIDKLNLLLEKRLSLKRNFLIGIVTGIGSAIGALLIGSILVGLLMSNLDRIPLLRDIFPPETIQEYVGIKPLIDDLEE